MKRLYSYDNYEGDKGVIIADSFEEAVALYKEQYPDREVADTMKQYWDYGCYIEEIDFMPEESRLYVTCEW